MADKRIFGNDGPSKPDLPKSTFDKSYTNNLSARFGRLYPVFCDMVPPNSTAHITPHMAFDMMPTVSPIQANIRSHLSIYKIPLRITWRNYKDFFSRVGNHQVPYIHRTGRWCETGSLADYMGIPTMNFRKRLLPSKLQFVNRGYIEYQYIRDHSLVDQVVAGRFSDTAVLDIANTPLGDYSPIHFMSSLISEESNGLFEFQYLMNPGESVTNNAFSSDYNDMFVAAFLLKTGDTRAVEMAPADSAAPWRETVLRASVVKKMITGRLDNVTGNHNYPYDTVTPGGFALSQSSSTFTVAGSDVTQKIMACRLSDSFLTLLNELIVEARGSAQKVMLMFGWRAMVTIDQRFGQFQYVPGYTPVVNQSGLSVSLDNPIHSSYTEGQQVKDSVSNLLSNPVFNLPLHHLTGNCTFHGIFVANDPDSENPFVAPADGAPKLPVNAFAFRAYEFIYNFFFRNDRVDPFMKLNPDTGEMEPTYNQFLTNDGDGADSTTPVDFFTAPYEYDLFTTCQKTPQFGNAPLVGITTNDDGETAEILMRGQRLVDGQPEDFDYTIAVRLGDDNRIMQISNYDEIADQPSVMRLNEAIRYGISINDFRSVNAFQIMQERFLKAGYQYRDLVKEFFGTTPPIGEEFPEYLGGVTRDVTVRKIENVALSADAQLGEFAGTGQVAGHGERVECFCSEWSIIMGVMWFSVTPVYSQKIDKHFLYHTYFDFYNPALMSIGPQPVFNYQLAPLQLPRNADGTIDEEHLADVFGYNRPWSDMVSKQDEAHGEFRGSMHSYLLQRLFQTVPKLGHDFLHISPEDLTDIFSYVQDTDKFYGAIRFEYYCKMPLPKVSLPRII